MVKVTFNSALAQKETKKDELKSGEEALIIPPDAVAVDCKISISKEKILDSSTEGQSSFVTTSNQG